MLVYLLPSSAHLHDSAHARTHAKPLPNPLKSGAARQFVASKAATQPSCGAHSLPVAQFPPCSQPTCRQAPCHRPGTQRGFTVNPGEVHEGLPWRAHLSMSPVVWSGRCHTIPASTATRSACTRHKLREHSDAHASRMHCPPLVKRVRLIKFSVSHCHDLS